MKTKVIKAEIVVNIGNYETARLGGEWELEKGESEAEAIEQAIKTLRGCEWMCKRGGVQVLETLTENHERYAKVVKALKSGKATIEQVEKVFTLTDQVRKQLTSLVETKEKLQEVGKKINEIINQKN